MTDNENPETFFVNKKKSYEAMGNPAYTDANTIPGIERFISQSGNGVQLVSRPPRYQGLPKLPPVKR